MLLFPDLVSNASRGILCVQHWQKKNQIKTEIAMEIGVINPPKTAHRTCFFCTLFLVQCRRHELDIFFFAKQQDDAPL